MTYLFSARRWVGWLLVLTFAVHLGPSSARASEAPAVVFNLPAGGLPAAIKEFSLQSGEQVIVPSDFGDGVQTPEVKGRMTPQAALDRLLAGTPLTAVADPETGAFAIVRRPIARTMSAPKNAAAVIVVGLAADPTQLARLWQAAETARRGFLARGFPADAVTLLPRDRATRATRDAIAAALGAIKPSVAETWLVLLGTAAPGRDGNASYQVSGPRVSTSELGAWVAALPGRKFVTLATTRSGGFLPALAALPATEAVAATAADREFSEPRFAEFWAQELGTRPEASFRELAMRTSERVLAFYRDKHLGVSEHAVMIDRDSGTVIPVPSATSETNATP